MDKTKLIVVVGPTAAGKTGLAIKLAQQYNGEVISADSRQVYTGLDIGTEKVSTEEMAGIPHHLIDIVPPESVYSVADFKTDAAKAIEDITARGKLPIIAGGTFFYIDALLGRISTPEVPPDPTLRAHLEEMSNETLFASLERLDPDRAFHIDPNNKRRLVRALEIIKSIGKVPKPMTIESPYDTYMIGISTDRTELRERLKVRANSALERGLIAETEKVLAAGLDPERLSEIGLEYRLVMEYLVGEVDENTLRVKLVEKNWQYAKRQLTWLKRDDSIVWVNQTDMRAIESHVSNFLS